MTLNEESTMSYSTDNILVITFLTFQYLINDKLKVSITKDVLQVKNEHTLFKYMF